MHTGILITTLNTRPKEKIKQPIAMKQNPAPAVEIPKIQDLNLESFSSQLFVSLKDYYLLYLPRLNGLALLNEALISEITPLIKDTIIPKIINEFKINGWSEKLSNDQIILSPPHDNVVLLDSETKSAINLQWQQLLRIPSIEKQVRQLEAFLKQQGLIIENNEIIRFKIPNLDKLTDNINDCLLRLSLAQYFPGVKHIIGEIRTIINNITNDFHTQYNFWSNLTQEETKNKFFSMSQECEMFFLFQEALYRLITPIVNPIHEILQQALPSAPCHTKLNAMFAGEINETLRHLQGIVAMMLSDIPVAPDEKFTLQNNLNLLAKEKPEKYQEVISYFLKVLIASLYKQQNIRDFFTKVSTQLDLEILTPPETTDKPQNKIEPLFDLSLFALMGGRRDPKHFTLPKIKQFMENVKNKNLEPMDLQKLTLGL